MKKVYLLPLMALTGLSLFSACSQNTEKTELTDNLTTISSNTSKIPLDTQLGEVADPDEEAATRVIMESSLAGLKKDFTKPPVTRDVHVKHHGCVKAIFRVNNNQLDPKYRVGVFAQNK